jgi:hypothetical protein
MWSIGVGGNLPVDSAIFLGMSAITASQSGFCLYEDMPEFIPASHQYLLTVLSIWWALGQLLGSLVGLCLVSERSVLHLEYRWRGH